VADTDAAPLTGAVSLHDVIRHLIHFGAARNDAERAELTAAVDRDDPDGPEPEDKPVSDAEKIAEYDRLKAREAAQAAPAPSWQPPAPVPAADDTTGGNG